MAEQWCDLCDLPLATCVHGMPAPVEQPKPAPAARKRSATPRRSPSRTPSRPGSQVTVRHTARSFTPPASFRPHIVAVLGEQGGSMDVDALMDAVVERMQNVLVDGDHESVNGEVRWRYTARQERAAMVRDGLMLPPAQPGRWELA